MTLPLTDPFKASTGTWPNRDPFLENAFNYYNNSGEANEEGESDLNKYEFVRDCPVAFVDLRGGSVFCKCDYNPPSLPFDMGSATMDVKNKPGFTVTDGTDFGVHICATKNQAVTFNVTEAVGCIERLLLPNNSCSCYTKECHVQKCFTCSMGTLKNDKAKPRWLFTSCKITQSCQ